MKNTITREEVISAFVNLEMFIKDCEEGKKKWYGLSCSNDTYDGMFIAMGYISGCLFKENSADVLMEVSKRTR